MLRQFFVDTLNLPYPVAAWLTAFCDMLYQIATTPVGMLFAAAFLIIGYFRFGVVSVASFAAIAAFGMVHSRWQAWAAYSDSWRLEQSSIVVSASLLLCLAAYFIGRHLRPDYL